MAFQSEPHPEERFPHHPLFAHGHDNNVGCWVTVDGRIDGEYVDFSIVATCVWPSNGIFIW